MTKIQILSLIMLIISTVATIAHLRLPNKSLLRFYTAYDTHKQKDYNWDKTIQRTLRGYMLTSFVSGACLILSFLTDIDDKIYLGWLVVALIIYSLLSRPVAKGKARSV